MLANKSFDGEDLNTLERLALVGISELGEETTKILQEMDADINIVELLESFYIGHQIEKNMLVENRLKANLVINDRIFLEVHENITMHHSGDKLMGRGRLTQEVLNKLKGKDAKYVAISLVEMEAAQNEAEYLHNLLPKA